MTKQKLIKIITEEIINEFMLPEYVIYRNKPYTILWRGITKDGRNRSLLKFINGSKEFWVDTKETIDGPMKNPSKINT